MSADPRSRTQRRRDTEHRLTHDVNIWVPVPRRTVRRIWCRCPSTGTARRC
jgi:hypothetical protein